MTGRVLVALAAAAVAVGAVVAAVAIGEGDDRAVEAAPSPLARWSHDEVELSSTRVSGTGGGQPEFSLAVSTLSTRHGQDLRAGSAVDGDPAWVVLPAEPTAADFALLGGLSGDTDVLWGEVLPGAAFERAGPGIYDAAADATGRLLTFVSGPNRYGTRLELTYNTTDGEPLTEAEVEAAVREVASTYQDGLLPMPVDITFDSTLEPAVLE